MIKPLYDKVVLKVKKEDKVTTSGIILPESASDKSNLAIVIAVGPGSILESGALCAVHVKVGDTVLFSPYGGTEVKVDGSEYLVLSEKDILAVIE
ncbi:10 kDa chaperonin [Erysipelotrichaceae bacterium]|nr:10 kDa chaperonin [Erysipelotrichaceae bacterium]